MKNDFIGYWMIQNLRPVKFHAYESVIMGVNRFMELEYTHGDCVDRFQTLLADWFNTCNISAHRDNKIVFECLDSTGRTICFGFYDNNFSMGWAASH